MLPVQRRAPGAQASGGLSALTADIRLRFVLTDNSLVGPAESRPISRAPAYQSPGVIHSHTDDIRPPGVLPAGAGVQFLSDELANDRVTGASVRVRWLDHAGHNWQHDYLRHCE